MKRNYKTPRCVTVSFCMDSLIALSADTNTKDTMSPTEEAGCKFTSFDDYDDE